VLFEKTLSAFSILPPLVQKKKGGKVLPRSQQTLRKHKPTTKPPESPKQKPERKNSPKEEEKCHPNERRRKTPKKPRALKAAASFLVAFSFFPRVFFFLLILLFSHKPPFRSTKQQDAFFQ
jgi:outer membrane biosynthesis protein TonB